jgi:hypothetical protein
MRRAVDDGSLASILLKQAQLEIHTPLGLASLATRANEKTETFERGVHFRFVRRV